MLAKAGDQLDGFAQLRDDGSTACGCWIFCGAWNSKGNMMARRDNADPSGLGSTLGWAFAWPANRRILYNRASADPSGKPWDPKRKVIGWNGQKWAGIDVPDFKADSPPDDGMNPFIMNPEGVARFFAVDKMAEGPVPRALRAVRVAAGEQSAASRQPAGPLQPGGARVQGRPADLRRGEGLPLCGHHLPADRAFPLLDQAREASTPSCSPSSSSRSARSWPRRRASRTATRCGCAPSAARSGRWRWSPSGCRRSTSTARRCITVGIPIHWGFKGEAKKGYLTNTLTPYVGDANTQTPEFKAFLVNVAKA